MIRKGGIEQGEERGIEEERRKRNIMRKKVIEGKRRKRNKVRRISRNEWREIEEKRNRNQEEEKGKKIGKNWKIDSKYEEEIK